MQGAASEENLTAGPLEERVEAKNWKVRVAAYQELKTLLVSAMPGDAVFATYGGALKKMVGDTNAAAQADAMEAVLAWVQYADRVKDAVALPPVLVERGFNAQRQATRQRAVDVLLMIIEREEIECVWVRRPAAPPPWPSRPSLDAALTRAPRRLRSLLASATRPPRLLRRPFRRCARRCTCLARRCCRTRCARR